MTENPIPFLNEMMSIYLIVLSLHGLMDLEEGDLIVAIDVGKGTEDILIHRIGTNFENSIQLVMPSMTQIIYNRIQRHSKSTLKIAGDLMAGEPWHKLVYNWKGRVLMTKQAAFSLKYNLDFVLQKGIEVVDAIEDPDICLTDVGWNRLKGILANSGYCLTEVRLLLICAQEHGRPFTGGSVKDFRMDHIWGSLDTFPNRLIRGDAVPGYAPRLKSLVDSALREFPLLTETQVFVMDSSAAVLAGAHNPKDEELVVNVGNGHVSAVHHREGRILFIYEGHTGKFNQNQFFTHMDAIYQGNLTHRDVIESGGHGLKIISPNEVVHARLPSIVSVLGPNRRKFSSVNVKWPHPIGNMMMAGPYGLIRCLYSKLGWGGKNTS